jgi:hypothetical protein
LEEAARLAKDPNLRRNPGCERKNKEAKDVEIKVLQSSTWQRRTRQV